MDFLSVSMLLKLKVLSKPGLAYAGLAVVAVLIVLEWRGVTSRKVRLAISSILTLLVMVSVASYLEFGQFRYGRLMNPHDVFHYYMGSKYSREIGYSHLYSSTLVADAQTNKLFDLSRPIRSQQDYHFVSPKTVLKDAAKYEGLFTPERWRDFKQDVVNFQSRMPKSRFNAILRDKGYNATPVWNMVARALTNTFGTRTQQTVNALLFLDFALLAAMFVTIWAAFGGRIMALAVLFFASNFFMSYPHIRGAFLRLDWVTLVVMSICALKLNRYKTAGAMMAYAALARVFPAIFVFGIGARFVWEVIRTRRLSRKYIEFFVAFALTSAVLVGLSIIDDGDLHLWREFRDKITLHNNDLAPVRVGFKYVFLHTDKVEGAWGQFEAAKLRLLEERRLLWLAIQGTVLAACFLASRKLRDYEALALGYAPAYFLVAPTFYYHVMLIVPFMFFAGRPDSYLRLIGAAGMFALSGAAYFLNGKYPLDLFLSYLLSWMLLGLASYQVLAAFLTRREQEAMEDTMTCKADAAPGLARPQAVLLCAAPVLWAAYAIFTLLRAHAGPAPATSALAGKLKSRPGVVQLAFAGDVMMTRGIERTRIEHNLDFTYPLKDVIRYLKGADAAFCNLDTPVSTLGAPIEKRYVFRSPPETADALSRAGFDVVSLANDHVLDFGPEAMADTVERIKAVNIAPIGLASVGESQQPVTLTANGVKVGFLGYVDPESRYGAAPEYEAFNPRPAQAALEQCEADIRALKGKADVVVVSMHWGTEYVEKPDARQVEFGRFLIDAGAHVVAGHHPHVQQEPEWYNGGVIIHSMGNFVFDQWSRPPTRVSRLYRVYVGKSGVAGVEYLPLDKEKDSWRLFATADHFTEVPAPPPRQPMPVRRAAPNAAK